MREFLPGLPEQGVATNQAQQPAVRSRERVKVEFGCGYPFQGRAIQRLRLVSNPAAGKETQVYRLLRIGMGEAFDETADGNLDAQFLHQLAGQAGFKCLIGLAFSARKFPEPPLVRGGVAPRDKELALAKDQTGGDLNDAPGALSPG